ncbi:MAG: gliding motility-associated C-terminal domain-containing protein [Bacteroidota bacterium]
MKYPVILISLALSFLLLKPENSSPTLASKSTRSDPGGDCVELLEKEFLTEFFIATNGENWTTKWGWYPTPVRDTCLYGVCPNEEGTIGCLNLANSLPIRNPCNENINTPTGNNLKGELPSPFQLPELWSLILSKNELSGPLPDFSPSQELMVLYLDANEFSDSIPTSLLSLSKLEQLFLQNNNLSGRIPENIAASFPQLKRFSANSNHFSGLIPDFKPTDSNNRLLDVQLDGNRFTFEDILPHFDSNEQLRDRFNVHNQAKVYVDTCINAAIGYPLLIDLEIDDTVATNIYDWYKQDTIHLRQETVNTFYIEEISPADSGRYTCTITNTIIPPDTSAIDSVDGTDPFLTLYSHPITIKPCLPGVLNLRDTFLCEGQSLHFDHPNGTGPLVYDADNPTDTIIYSGLADNGCDSIIEISLQYYPTDVVAIAEAEATFTCQPELMIQANTAPFTTGFWNSPGSPATFDDTTAAATTVRDLQPGNNTIVWYLLHESCRDLNATDTIEVFYQPEFALSDTTFTIIDHLPNGKRLEVPLSDSLRFLQEWHLEIVTPPTQGEMQFDTTTGIIWRYQRFDSCPGEDFFQYQLVNEDCVYSDIATVRIHVVPRPRDDNKIPDVVTPNGDGFNDTFIIPGIHNKLPGFEDNRLIIFNSRGNVVFDQQDYQNDWDGGGLPTAVYHYHFKVGEQKPFYGQVSIIR